MCGRSGGVWKLLIWCRVTSLTNAGCTFTTLLLGSMVRSVAAAVLQNASSRTKSVADWCRIFTFFILMPPLLVVWFLARNPSIGLYGMCGEWCCCGRQCHGWCWWCHSCRIFATGWICGCLIEGGANDRQLWESKRNESRQHNEWHVNEGSKQPYCTRAFIEARVWHCLAYR